MQTIDTKLKTLQQKRQAIEKGGGEKRIQKQHKSGKLTARERIEKLLDKDSFVEIDAFVEHRSIQFDMQNTKAPGEGVVTGYGTIDSQANLHIRPRLTTIGGSLGENARCKNLQNHGHGSKNGSTSNRPKRFRWC